MKTSLLLLALAAPALAERAWCTRPDLHHAVVVFGNDDGASYSYQSDAHTIGTTDATKGFAGLAVKGKAEFPRTITMTVGDTQSHKSIITGAITMVGPLQGGGWNAQDMSDPTGELPWTRVKGLYFPAGLERTDAAFDGLYDQAA